MQLDRVRLYAAVLIIVMLLIVAGAIIVMSRSPITPTQSALTWSGGAPISAYQNSSANAQSPQQIAQEVVQNQAPATLILPPLAQPAATTSQQETAFNYQDFFAQVSGSAAISPSTAANNASANAAIGEAYEFIPTGLVATTAPAKKQMTADQKTLYDYGNSVGAEIQSFEELHGNQAEILKDQAQDRTDPVKAAALTSLGQALSGVGMFLQQMQEVPPEVSVQHGALAKSYIDIGTKLQMIARAQSDADFVQAVENYDMSADTFVKNYAAVAQYFSEQAVTFSPQDPGSVFSFTNSGGGGL